jgi:hypothetical protein
MANLFTSQENGTGGPRRRAGGAYCAFLEMATGTNPLGFAILNPYP